MRGISNNINIAGLESRRIKTNLRVRMFRARRNEEEAMTEAKSKIL